MMATQLREDIFISVCLSNYVPGAIDTYEWKQLVEKLSSHYKFWEILLAVYADQFDDCSRLLLEIPNLRIIILRDGTPFYRRQVAIAEEAIGDVILMSTIDEMSNLDPIELIDSAHASDAIVVGRRKQSGLLNPVLVALGRSAGFRVDDRNMMTAAFSRTQMNRILTHSDRELALRFPPTDDSIRLIWQVLPQTDRRRISLNGLGRRLMLVHRLVVSSAPRVLLFVSLISLLTALFSIAFMFYAIIVWFVMEQVQRGWFSTSIVISVTSAFLSISIFGISIGLQKIFGVMAGDDTNDIVSEHNNVDMFRHVFDELNVEIEDNDKP